MILYRPDREEVIHGPISKMDEKCRLLVRMVIAGEGKQTLGAKSKLFKLREWGEILIFKT